MLHGFQVCDQVTFCCYPIQWFTLGSDDCHFVILKTSIRTKTTSMMVPGVSPQGARSLPISVAVQVLCATPVPRPTALSPVEGWGNIHRLFWDIQLRSRLKVRSARSPVAGYLVGNSLTPAPAPGVICQADQTVCSIATDNLANVTAHNLVR